MDILVSRLNFVVIVTCNSAWLFLNIVNINGVTYSF
jgi:hypothetical protein